MTKTKTTSFTELVARNKGEYCRLLWRREGDPERNQYQIIFLTSYGDWATFFTIGGDSIAEFLAKLNSDYLGRKLIHRDQFIVYCEEKTAPRVKAAIIEARRAGDIEEDDAREYFDMAENELDEHNFHHLCRESNIQELYECKVHEPCNTWTCFWKYLWEPAVIPALLEVAESDEIAA